MLKYLNKGKSNDKFRYIFGILRTFSTNIVVFFVFQSFMSKNSIEGVNWIMYNVYIIL